MTRLNIFQYTHRYWDTEAQFFFNINGSSMSWRYGEIIEEEPYDSDNFLGNFKVDA